jgi:hypothetical protein
MQMDALSIQSLKVTLDLALDQHSQTHSIVNFCLSIFAFQDLLEG